MGLWSCAPEPKTIAENGGLIIKVTADNIAEGKETSDSIIMTLTKRFQHQYPDNNISVEYEEAYQLYSIEIPAADTNNYSRALILATATGNFEVSEVCRFTDFFEAIRNDTLYAENDTLSKLRVYDLFNLGAANISDTSAVNAFFDTPEIKNRLPKNYNIKLIWGEVLDKSYGDLEGMYPLYCLKNSPYNIPLSIACKEAKVDDNIYNHYLISITLKKEYAQRFENLTRNNIGHPLAIVCDNTVLSVPIVNDAITGGKLAISGNFEYDNLVTISSLLIGGQISTSLKVIDIQKF